GGTAGFLQSLAGSLPPALSMMKDIGGIEMPEFFGKLVKEAEAKKSGEAEPVKARGSGDGQGATAPRKGKGESR
ncbi:MAG: hypothetical protein ACE5F1_17915, partial [Planctomycetota bacterium]